MIQMTRILRPFSFSCQVPSHKTRSLCDCTMIGLSDVAIGPASSVKKVACV